MHLFLLALCGFTYIILGTVHRVSMNYVSWFIVLYFIASFIRMYDIELFARRKLWGGVCIISILLSITSIFACLQVGFAPYTFVSDSNTFLAVTTGSSAFLFFKNLKIQNSKIINTIESSTFGVLLIHASGDTMRKWLWKDLFNNVDAYINSDSIVHALTSTIIIFIVCVIIDQIRINLLEKPFMKWIDKRLLEGKL